LRRFGSTRGHSLVPATEATIERTFFLLLDLFAAAPFHLLLHYPLLCHLRGVGSAQGGHQPRVKELGQVPALRDKTGIQSRSITSAR